MIKIRDLKVSSFSLDSQDLLWEIEETLEDVRDYDFFIQRSEGQEGPFDTIGGPLVDQYSFRDVQAPAYNRERQHLYRIRIVKRDTGLESFSSVEFQIAPQDLIAAEIQRSEFLRLREYVGRKVFIFQKRTFGQRCLTCWDPIKQRLTVSSCPECFNTGFSRGFMRPVSTYMQIDPATGLAGQAEQLSDLGKTQHSIVRGRTILHIIMKSGDLVMELENIRWRITGTLVSDHIRHPVTQDVTMMRIPETDIEYSIPLAGVDPATFQASPARAFRNPMNIDAVLKESERISV